MKPTKEMEGALSGAFTLEEISPASVSALRLVIYKHALSVLSLRTNERKRKYIEKLPAGIQVMLRAECRRLFDMRKQ